MLSIFKDLEVHTYSLLFQCYCNQTQVQLPASLKANTQEAGADLKGSGLFRCQPPGRWGTLISKPISAPRASWLVHIGEPWEEEN